MTDRSSYQRTYQKDYQARTKRVNLLLSASEFRELERGAGRKGEALATYAKRCALEAHRGKAEAYLPEPILERLTELDRVMRTMANNLNQMARHSHRIAHVLDENEPFLYLRRLEVELRAALAATLRFGADDQGEGPASPEDSPR